MPNIFNTSSATLTNYSIANTFSSGLLTLGKQVSQIKGIGLSASARDITDNFVSSSQQGSNNLFSAGTASSAQDLQTQVLALRASFSKNLLSQSLQQAADASTSVVPSATKGQNVNKTA